MPAIDNIMHRTMTPIIGYEDESIAFTPSGFDSAEAKQCNVQQTSSFPKYNSYRSNSGAQSNKGVRPKSTMQMLSDAVYRREVQKLANKGGVQRPFTADMLLQARSTFNPYQTSYNHEYYRKDEPESMNVRPASHIQLSSAALRDETTYHKEYTGERAAPNGRLWSGGNNPHPSQAFMVWKYPTRKSNSGTEGHVGLPPTLTNADFDKAMRGKSKSTYQMDYKGLPPGYMPAEFADVANDWKSSVPYTLDSEKRISYQKPNQPKALGNKIDRFGHAGHDRHRLLIGITPNASQRRRTVPTATTYDKYYNETAPGVSQEAFNHFPTHARTVVKGKSASELSAMYEDIKRQYFPRYARTSSRNSPLNGYTTEVPLTPQTGIPHLSPGVGGVLHIPEPSFVTTPVPEPICEPV